MNLNKPVDTLSLSTKGFSLKVDDEPVDIIDISQYESNTKTVEISLGKIGTITDQTILTISYEGSHIKAEDGTFLEQFEELSIRNTLPRHFEIPGKIEAESFYINQGLEIEETSDIGGGQNIGYTSAGDYLDYKIIVKDSGEYKIEARIACYSNGGQLEIQQLDTGGQIINSSTLPIPVTGGWQNWQTVSASINLNKGIGTLRALILQPEFNINWLNFSAIRIVNGTEDLDWEEQINIYPNPASTHVSIAIPKNLYHTNNQISIKDTTGKLVYQKDNLTRNEVGKLQISPLPKGIYLVVLRMNTKSWKRKLLIN
ncbi:carbohydrate-binding protein [Flammeovirgaceae bacterium SG7u.111]|nr:carbohydrate-binding protein [Flammeovirgaceae bacterium SG7u.132]WPO33525.1 carbohydrate-binding protein [Flammeovirgaceae bacterium SG7u.111]